MKLENLFFTKFRYLGFLLAVVLFVIPYLYNGMDNILESIFIGIGVAIFSSLVISLYYDKQFMDLLCGKILPFREQIKDSGLEGIVYKNNMRELGVDIVKSNILIIAMNDGKNFLSNNSTELSERYKDKKKVTKIILFDPESKHEDVLCQQNGKECGVYKTKIKDVIKELQNKIISGAKIEIYVTNSILRTHTVITDDFAISGVYRNSQGKDNYPPSYIYSCKGKEYKYIKHDIEKIQDKAKKI